MEEYKIEYAINKFFRMVKVRMFQDEKNKIKQKQAIINYGLLLHKKLSKDFKIENKTLMKTIEELQNEII